jgi:hypothetical protein
MNLTKTNLIQVLNENITGKKTGKKEFQVSDIFIYSFENEKNFRLTTLGRDIMSKVFDSYNIDLTSSLKGNSGKQILLLDKYMLTPYFLSPTKTLIVYEEAIASEFLLIDSNLDDWVEMKSFYED